MKKVFAVFLIAAMSLCFMPSMTFAADSGADSQGAAQIGKYYEVDDSSGTWQSDAVPSLSEGSTQQVYEDGQVKVNKTITGTGTENVFNVNLEVITQDKIEQKELSEDAAVVLVIDVSGSMDGKRIRKTKEAAQKFINSFADAGEGVTRKIAIVKFSGDSESLGSGHVSITGAETVQSWTDASSLKKNGTDQCEAIKNLTANGGTNISAGIQLAKNLLNDQSMSGISNKNIVLLTDGQPTFGIGTGKESGTETVCNNGTNMIGNGYSANSHSGNPAYHDIHQQVENLAATLVSDGITPYAVFVGSDSLSCKYEEWVVDDGWPKHEKCYAKNMKCSTWLATKCGFTTFEAEDVDDLTEIFDKISELIKLQAQAWQLTDPMGTYVDCITNFTSDDANNGIRYESRTLHWNLRQAKYQYDDSEKTYTYSLTYQIRLNNLAEGFTAETYYPTNGVTSLTYLITSNVGSSSSESPLKTAYFNIPSVKGLKGGFSFNKVDENEKPMAGAGFTLTAKDNSAYKLTAASASDGTVTFANIPSGHEYTLSETTVPTGYQKAADKTISIAYGESNAETVLPAGTIKNVPETTSVTVSKKWEDNNNQDGLRPGSVTVQLLAGGKDTGKTVTLNADNNWTDSFTDLPVRSSGEPIAYTVEEISVSGYNSELTGDAENGFVITNTHTPETISISGSKTWRDDDNASKARPESITVKLLANGEQVNSKTVSADENWSWSFDNLPKYKDGNEIKYSISEEAVKDYSASYSAGNITNTYTPGKTSITVEKVWEDNDDQDKIRPGDVTVELLADGVATGKTIELNETNNWEASFTDLSLTNDDGKIIIYTVQEETIGGYTASIEQNGSKFIITNTHTPATTTVSGSKTWKDDNDRDRKRPDSITINLLADGTKVDSKTVTAADNWAWEFAGLAKNSNGNEIIYTITEEPVADYTATIKDYNVTNSYTPGKTSVTVTKVWDDGDDKDRIRPESITVWLLVNGTAKESMSLSKENNWTGTFTNLPQKEDGEDIVYSVQEVSVEGYTSVITGNATEGFTITNSPTPKEEPPVGPTHTYVSVHKEWKLDDGGTAADSVTVQLYRNGLKYGVPVTLSKDNNWTYSWSPLYVYGDIWTVEEVNVPEGFTATVTKADYTNNFTIINDDVKTEEPGEPDDPDQPDTPDTPDKPSKPDNFDKPDTDGGKDASEPQTGDTEDMGLWLILLTLAASGMGVTLRSRRKEQ